MNNTLSVSFGNACKLFLTKWHNAYGNKTSVAFTCITYLVLTILARGSKNNNSSPVHFQTDNNIII